MSPIECPFEDDALTAVTTNRWPERVEPALREHVSSCAICTDIIAIAPLLAEDADVARQQANVPDAGLIWWRAQMRARAEAARTAVRPITVAQAVGFAAAVGVAGAIFGASATWFQSGLRSLYETAASVVPLTRPELPAELSALVTEHSVWLTGGALCFVLAAFGLYLAVKEQET